MVRPAPRSFAGSAVPSGKITVTSKAPSTTCRFVTISPDGSMMKPDPKASTRRGAPLSDASVTSVDILCVVMFTTVCSILAIRWVRPNGSRSRSVWAVPCAGNSVVADARTAAAMRKAPMPRQRMTLTPLWSRHGPIRLDGTRD